MTKFDNEATPFCDFLDLDRNTRDWKGIARLIERRARSAEERLRITNQMLEITERHMGASKKMDVFSSRDLES